MVDIRAEQRRVRPGNGSLRRTGVTVNVWFNPDLFEAIRAEAERRGWTLNRMIRFLCEASIDGVE